MITVHFPKLEHTDYRITSPKDSLYNCIAWAIGEKNQWWDPTPGYYWPKKAPISYKISALVRAMELQGFSEIEEQYISNGMEHLAIYAKGDEFTHVTRQLPNGSWASKLGDWEDIEHLDVRGLEGNFYGRVTVFMQRTKVKLSRTRQSRAHR